MTSEDIQYCINHMDGFYGTVHLWSLLFAFVLFDRSALNHHCTEKMCIKNAQRTEERNDSTNEGE